MREREPERLRVLDLIGLVVGSGVGLALVGEELGLRYAMTSPEPAWVVIGLVAALAALGIPVLLRRFVYGGMPRAGEWLALMALGLLISSVLPDVDSMVNWAVMATGRVETLASDYPIWRWGWAGVSGLMGAGLVAVAWRRRGGGGEGARSLLVVGACIMLFWGPMTVFTREVAGMILVGSLNVQGNPPGGWGLAREAALQFVGYAPFVLAFAIPGLMAVRSRLAPGRRSAVWTERASVLIFASLGVALGVIVVVRSRQEEGVASAVGLVVVLGIAWFLSRRLERLRWLVKVDRE